eukprot:TRINITY_DN83499_c0_g1_i1.p1 TRINITY_DN83499_c0_g1~~TRINITY_DN83499_c0_g1_i1.p1  ORF type:complete len:507 (+),score=115.98 TRINITY_DN83499_c0_g1_i1:133-1653(+)
MAKPQTPRSGPASWSVSFTEASKFQYRSKIKDDETLAKWNAGNNDSSEFFRKMGSSLADTDRALRQCRKAAMESPARNTEEKVNMDNMRRNIQAAKTLAKFATASIVRDKVGNALETGTCDAPQCLSHLIVPGAKEKAAATRIQSLERSRQARKKVDDIRHGREGSQTARGKSEAPKAMPEESKMSSQDAGADVIPDIAIPDLPQSPDDRRPSENSLATFGDQSPKEGAEDAPRLEPLQKQLSEEMSTTSSDTEIDDGNGYTQPRAPYLRFRAQMMFNGVYKGSADAEAILKQEREAKACVKGKDDELTDSFLGWINTYFALTVKTEQDLEAAFAIIVLSMIDVIYCNKVPWIKVDWNASYTHALNRNHALLQKVWREVNMDKLPFFRHEGEAMRIEFMTVANSQQKLDFLKQAKRWFDQRVQNSSNFNAVERRTQIEKMVRLSGRTMKFPLWMQYDAEAVNAARYKKPTVMTAEERAKEAQDRFDSMPEFKRLTWFLGSTDAQGM